MNTEMERIFNSGIVPVVVIEDAKNAVPTAKALRAGGIEVVEITMRTSAGLESIENITRELPTMMVIAGTVLTLEKCKQCIAAGARGIVSPGFDPTIVKYCIDNHVNVIPGCVTPTEIQQALSYNLSVLKFFPANVYGGIDALKALAGPFENVSFIPTGGVNEANIGEFAAVPNVFAVGGSWICTKADIAANAIDRITALTIKARQNMHGFEFAHMGINTDSADSSQDTVDSFLGVFNFPVKLGSSSNFSGASIEVMKEKYLGEHGHIAVRTNNIKRAIPYLAAKGYALDPDTAKYKNERMIAIYLKNEIGGFAIHLLQK
jgi:2-dehydro-3-deoxyphosphogluconate aldolase/(4S)-4-hydroxy-2-oxoglutarate aldolase